MQTISFQTYIVSRPQGQEEAVRLLRPRTLEKCWPSLLFWPRGLVIIPNVEHIFWQLNESSCCYLRCRGSRSEVCSLSGARRRQRGRQELALPVNLTDFRLLALVWSQERGLLLYWRRDDRLRGPSPNFNFFLFLIQSFWKLHTICEIESRINFCYKFNFFHDYRIIFSEKKKHFFKTLLKRLEVG